MTTQQPSATENAVPVAATAKHPAAVIIHIFFVKIAIISRVRENKHYFGFFISLFLALGQFDLKNPKRHATTPQIIAVRNDGYYAFKARSGQIDLNNPTEEIQPALNEKMH
ncbi:hypothetical protein T10_3365 [Trichinella papuae]|uniref:Uncharacterized protein n=1 Tax=Trichinella papuae TaxID=268474 RepID=A0A0V1M9U0_9BILA|nr:hypothetical protein T10_3365 [Trichinella papuae]